MKQQIIKEIVKDICDSYYDVLITGLEEEKNVFPLTLCIIDFITALREKNIVCDLNDIFVSTFLDKMFIETNKYIGR